MDLRYERRAWTLIYLCLGVIEGGTAAVMVRSLFGDAVAGIVVDLVLAVAVLARLDGLLWPGALLMGASLAAGSLGWSLGHNDFAPRGEETRYMALHVTLTGLRGLIAPPVAILVYYALQRVSPGLEPWVMLLPVALIVWGAWTFAAMRRGIAGRGAVQ